MEDVVAKLEALTGLDGPVAAVVKQAAAELRRLRCQLRKAQVDRERIHAELRRMSRGS